MAPDRQLSQGATSQGATSNGATSQGAASNGATDAAAGQPAAPPETGEMKLPLHARTRAARIVQSPDKLQKMVDEAREKAQGTSGASNPIASVIDDLKTMFELLRAVAKGDYRVRKETLILIAGAVLYFLIPIDVIPDFIPIAGFLDDAAVIAWVVRTCKKEIDLFRARTTFEDDGAEVQAGTASAEEPA